MEGKRNNDSRPVLKEKLKEKVTVDSARNNETSSWDDDTLYSQKHKI